MRVTIITIGSRGDMQPYVALGRGLQAAGFTVRLATHAEYESFVRSYGLDFAPLAGNPRATLESEQGQNWLASGKNPLLFVQRMRQLTRSFANEVMRDALAACQGADVIISGVLGLFVAPHVAEKLGIPYFRAVLQPLQPSRYINNTIFPNPAGWLPSPVRQTYNWLTFPLGDRLMTWAFGGIINDLRRDLLDLPGQTHFGWLPAKSDPVMYGFSPQVVPKPPDYGAECLMCGYWFLDHDPDWRPPADLLDFLDAGEPPVYVGFGSMSNRDPQQTADIVLSALHASGRRGVLITGWSGLSNDNLPDHVFAVDTIPHDWLFPRMAAVVHHGGMGTTAAGLRAGVPTVVVPFFADQHFWGARVAGLGVGSQPIPRARLTAERLSAAIRQVTTDGQIQRHAAELGERIRAEDGVARAVEHFSRLVDRPVTRPVTPTMA